MTEMTRMSITHDKLRKGDVVVTPGTVTLWIDRPTPPVAPLPTEPYSTIEVTPARGAYLDQLVFVRSPEETSDRWYMIYSRDTYTSAELSNLISAWTLRARFVGTES